MTYEPDAEAARLAPACVCNVASRVLWLLQKLDEFDAETQAKLKPFVAALPFEAELLSGRMDAVDTAIKKIGQRDLDGSPNLSGDAQRAVPAEVAALEAVLRWLKRRSDGKYRSLS